MNLLFWISLGAFGASAAFFAKRQQTMGTPRTRKGPVPGYSISAGKDVSLNRDVVVPSLNLQPVHLEEFHSPGRTRLILTLELEEAATPDPRLAEHCEAIARDIQARAHAQVVVVDCLKAGRTHSVVLWAPDGRGWTGKDSVSTMAWSS